MAILIANLGTSDLSVRPQGKDVYLPVQFDRNEPNLVLPEPGSPEADIWQQREALVCDLLCPELGVAVTLSPQGKPSFRFREFTEKLWQAYQQDPSTWANRIRPGRIWGVMKSAQERFGLTKAYLFVSDQVSAHPQDTIYVFELLQHWLKDEMPDLTVEKVTIPPEIALNKDDPLLEFYAGFFNRLSREFRDQLQPPTSKTNDSSDASIDPSEPPTTNPDLVLVSIKGGTGQMQTALRIQAIASAIQHQAMLEPQMTVNNVLQGKPSPCKAGVYWQYAKSQRFQTVRLLLNERWDFDGAATILNDWQQFLSWLVENDLADLEVKASAAHLREVVAMLRTAQNAWNLAQEDAYRLATSPNYAEAGAASHLADLVSDEGYDSLLNLYTQCRILWKHGQTANFLVRMSSFYEEAQLQMLKVLGGEQVLVGDLEDWMLDAKKVKAMNDGELWQTLRANVMALPYHERFENHPFHRTPRFKIMGRDNKSALLKTLLMLQPDTIQASGRQLLEELGQLDFWASSRNKIIHQSSGLSPTKLDSYLKQEAKGPRPHPLAKTACRAGDILSVMSCVCASDLNLVRPTYQQKYLAGIGKGHFYIYGEARRWALEQLD